MSLGTILSKIAPELEAALPLVGGPYGAIASMAVKAVSSVVTPDDPNPTVASVAAALPNATPDQLTKLQEVNNDFKLKTQQLGIDTLKIQAELEEKLADDDTADRGSARASFAALRYLPQIILTVVYTVGFFGTFYFIFTHLLDMSKEQIALIASFAGVLLGMVTQQGNFWFGSSHGSQKKDDALAAAAAS